MSFKHAIALATSLRDTLRRELESTQFDRVALRSLDASQLLAVGARREAFHLQAATIQAQLHETLAATAKELQLPEVTLTALAAALPLEGRLFADLFSEIRSLAAALSDLDALHRQLAERALMCVRGYLTAVSPPINAYDRRGLQPAASGRATVSQHI